VPGSPFVILANVNEMEFFFRLQPFLQLRDSSLADALFRVLDERQKCGGMVFFHESQSTQSARKILISCGHLALRFDPKTNRLPFGENCEKALKPPVKVMGLSFEPSRFIA
jgi:hypothetical protein